MAHLHLQNVSLDYPVRGSQHVSAKRALLSALKISKIDPFHHVAALRGINLQIRDGARVGLYGPNGSGKTTLLRVLAGIYPPTSGTLTVEGRISALLGLGAGIHPDMTAEENIRLLLRLDGHEPTDGLVAEIWSFTELDPEFLLMPMASFSSGMTMRVLFATMTARPKEILLLDEWLGVADAAFQAKAEARMMEFVSKARILVIASHNFGLLQRLCHGVLHLEKGQVVKSEVFTRENAA